MVHEHDHECGCGHHHHDEDHDHAHGRRRRESIAYRSAGVCRPADGHGEQVKKRIKTEA